MSASHLTEGHTDTMLSARTPQEMLAQLVGFDTVVGHPNLPLIEAVADWLDGHGISCRILVGPTSSPRSEMRRDPDISCPVMSMSFRPRSLGGTPTRSPCAGPAIG
jgi:hypothetical protein